jgi:hypothetical protein
MIAHQPLLMNDSGSAEVKSRDCVEYTLAANEHYRWQSLGVGHF